MPTYTYKARDAAGKAVNGVLEAISQDEVAVKLRDMGYMVSRVDETPASSIGLKRFGDRLQTVKTREIILFNIQLANMTSAGVPILVSLKILEQQFEGRKLKRVIGEVSRSVEAGGSLSDALAAHPRVFSKLFISTVKAGETSGNLDTVLTRLASYLEKQEDLKEQIQGALFYPVILLFAGISVILLVVTFVIPQFVDIFMKAEVPLPLPTQIMHAVGIGLKRYWYLVIFGMGMLVMLARWIRRTDRGERVTDQMLLNIPVIGPLVRKVCISRFARTLSTLVASGVPMLTSLELVEEVVGNRVLGQVVHKTREAVIGGSKLAEPLRVSGEFPPETVQMVVVGEETGNLDELLDRVANFYDRIIDYGVKRLTTLIEPFFLVLMGGIVTLIIASVLFPIFDLATTIRH